MREQELEMLQREKEAEHFKTWSEQEDNFHLHQAKLRYEKHRVCVTAHHLTYRVTSGIRDADSPQYIQPLSSHIIIYNTMCHLYLFFSLTNHIIPVNT